jgi:hypothetical protein
MESPTLRATGGPIRLKRVVERWEYALTKPALDRARWCCESCHGDSDLRVAESHEARLVVLCARCRLGSSVGLR